MRLEAVLRLSPPSWCSWTVSRPTSSVFHLGFVEPLRQQLALGAQHLVEAVVAIAQRAGVARDAELFRRNRLDPGVRGFARAHAFHVVELRHAGRRRLGAGGGPLVVAVTLAFAVSFAVAFPVDIPFLRLAGGRDHRAGGVRRDLDIGIGEQQREHVVGEVVISFSLLEGLFLPPHLDDADLGQERVLDERVQDQEAGIDLHEHVVDVVGLLLGRRHVARPDRIEPDHVVAAAEDLDQRRHQALDGVGDVGRHRARAPLGHRHVACHVAEVVVHGVGALGAELGRSGERGERVGVFGREHRLELGRWHFWHGWSAAVCRRTRRRRPRRLAAAVRNPAGQVNVRSETPGDRHVARALRPSHEHRVIPRARRDRLDAPKRLCNSCHRRFARKAQA
jgi:hypothetical protein